MAESISTTDSETKTDEGVSEVMTSPVDTSEPTIELFEEDTVVIDGTSPPLSTEHVECLGGLTTKISQEYDAIQDFLYTPDARLSHEQTKETLIEKTHKPWFPIHSSNDMIDRIFLVPELGGRRPD